MLFNDSLNQARLRGSQRAIDSHILPSISKRSLHTLSSDADTSSSSNNKSHLSKSDSRNITPKFDDLQLAHKMITSGKAKTAKYHPSDSDKDVQMSSPSGAREQRMAMRGDPGLAGDLPLPPAPAYHGSSSRIKVATFFVKKREEGHELTTLEPRHHNSSSPMPSTSLFPHTPSGARLLGSKHNSASRPPVLGGDASLVQYPSKNPYHNMNAHSSPSFMISPPEDADENETYTPSKYGQSNHHSSPHGLPSPKGSSGEQRTFPECSAVIENMDDFDFDAGVGHEEGSGDESFFQPQDRNDGSTVGDIVDHYTQGSDGSRYFDNRSSAAPKPLQTPGSSRMNGASKLGSAAVTPSTESEFGYSLAQFPKQPAPAHLDHNSFGKCGSSSYGDSQELLDAYGGRSSPPGLPQLKVIRDIKRDHVPQSEIERQISLHLRDVEIDEDSYVEVSTPVRQKVVAPSSGFKSKYSPNPNAFQRCNDSSSGAYSDPADNTVRGNDLSANDEVGNVEDERERENEVEDFKVEKIHGPDGMVRRKLSKRKNNVVPVVEVDNSEHWTGSIRRKFSKRKNGAIPVVEVDDGGDDWVTISEDYDTSPEKLPFNIPESNDSVLYFSAHPYQGVKRVLVHPPRDGDKFDKHPRMLPNGSASILMPQATRQASGAFGMNSYRARTPQRLMRKFSDRVSSPLVFSSPRNEYEELDGEKSTRKSPFSPGRKGKGKAPVRRRSPAPWTDGPARMGYGGQESEFNNGFQFGKKQTPEDPGSFMKMIMAANDGKMPAQFVGDESPERISESPESAMEHPRPHFPPRIHSCGDSIADYSDEGEGEDFSGPEYQAHPISSVSGNAYMYALHPNMQFGSSASLASSLPEGSTHEARSRASQRPLAPGGFYNSIRGAKRAKRDASDIEASPGPRATFLGNINLRPLRMASKATRRYATPSIIRPRSGNEFVYRKPTAPIRDADWGTLYTREQLESIQTVNRRPEADDEQPHIAHVHGDSVSNADSWSKVDDVPHLTVWEQESSSLGDNATHKKVISNVVFVLCAIVSPLLPMYAMGWLDVLMSWMTSGKITHFGSGQKRVALCLSIFYLVCILVAGITIGVLRATGKL